MFSILTHWVLTIIYRYPMMRVLPRSSRQRKVELRPKSIVLAILLSWFPCRVQLLELGGHDHMWYQITECGGLEKKLVTVKSFWMHNNQKFIQNQAWQVWGVSVCDWPHCISIHCSLGSEHCASCKYLNTLHWASHCSAKPQWTMPETLWLRFKVVLCYELKCFYCAMFSAFLMV